MNRKIVFAISLVLTAILFFLIGKNFRPVVYKEYPKYESKASIDDIMAPAMFIKDYDFYRKTLVSLHPGLYKWHSKEEMTALLDSVGELLDKPISRAQFFTYLNIINSRIGCSHTRVDYNNEINQSGLFPFPIVCIDDNYYSTCLSCDVPKGCKILSVNGETMDQIANRLRIYESVDACNNSIALQRITENFPLKYYLAYGRRDKFDIKFEEPKTKRSRTITVESVPYNYVHAADWHTFWVDEMEYSFKMDDVHNTGILKLGTFTYGDGMKGDAFKNFLDNSFRLLSVNPSYKNLVIDLRNNRGGENSNCYLLYSYLTKNAFYEDSNSYINDFAFPETYVVDGVNAKDLDSFKRTYYRLTPDSARYVFIPAKAKKWAVSKHAFNGNVFVITNSITASASVRLASLLQTSDSAKIVGETPDGFYLGSTAYYNEKFHLPQSSISFTIPLVNVRYNLPPHPYRLFPGILPDYRVPLSPDDFLTGKDTQLEFIWKTLIKN